MNKHADFSFPLERNQEPSNNTQESIKYLSKKSIQLSNQELPLGDLMVPPTTPNDLIPDFEVIKVPQTFPKLSNVSLPLVREIGVKETIKVLAELYNCKRYKHNLVQFWFLDFMTDCLWKVQDEFQFPEEHQKVILEWVSYAFNLIRAPHLNLPRKQIFKIFNEALNIAELYIETGCEYLPLPEDLFTLSDTIKPPEKPSGSSSSSLDDPNITKPNVVRNNSYLAIELDDGVRFFDLPQKVYPWDSDNECLSSTVETVSENEIVIVKPENSDAQIAEDTSPDFDQANALMFEDFYKPDLSTPSRFAHSEDSSFSDSVSFSYESESIDLEEDDDEGNAGPPTWVMSKKKPPDAPCTSKLIELKPEEKKRSEKRKEEEAIQSWYDYHLWQFRKKSMNDSTIGYFSSEEKVDHRKTPENYKVNQVETKSNSHALATLTEYMKNIHDYMKELRHHRFTNTCVIMAIKEIVYDYFYDSFQFSAIKMVYRYPHLLHTQGLNKEWHTPKKTKTELKRPKPKKKKVEKPKKEKPQKTESAPPPKKEKKTAKKESVEQEVIPKDEKTEKDYEEEKKELEKLNQEKEKLKELERIAEENRTLVFPLTDAVDETFFFNIFPSIKQKKKGK